MLRGDPFHRVRTWRDDDPGLGAVTKDCVIGWIPVIGAIGSELANLIFNLVEQRLHLRGISAVLICQSMCNDLTAIGIKRQM